MGQFNKSIVRKGNCSAKETQTGWRTFKTVFSGHNHCYSINNRNPYEYEVFQGNNRLNIKFYDYCSFSEIDMEKSSILNDWIDSIKNHAENQRKAKEKLEQAKNNKGEPLTDKEVDKELEESGYEPPTSRDRYRNFDSLFDGEGSATADLNQGNFHVALKELKEIKNDIKKTKAEKAEDYKVILARIDEEVRKNTEPLDEKIQKLQEEKQKAQLELRTARDSNDSQGILKAVAKIKETESKIADIVREKDDLNFSKKAKNYIDEEIILNQENLSWYQKIDFKNPTTYYYLGSGLVLIFSLWWVGKKIWNWFRGN